MDINKFRNCAGLPTLNIKDIAILEKRLSDVKTKVEIPEGLFTKKAKAIAKTLISLHDGDIGKAIKALTFYVNRAGDDVSNKEELDKAKEILSSKLANESINSMRKAAGLPLIESKDKDSEEDEELPPEEGVKDLDKKDSDKKDEDEADDLPSIVKKLAKKAVGKTEEELDELLMKVYQAGFGDGQASKDKEEAPGEDESAEKASEDEVKKSKKDKEVKESLIALAAAKLDLNK